MLEITPIAVTRLSKAEVILTRTAEAHSTLLQTRPDSPARIAPYSTRRYWKLALRRLRLVSSMMQRQTSSCMRRRSSMSVTKGGLFSTVWLPLAPRFVPVVQCPHPIPLLSNRSSCIFLSRPPPPELEPGFHKGTRLSFWFGVRVVSWLLAAPNYVFNAAPLKYNFTIREAFVCDAKRFFPLPYPVLDRWSRTRSSLAC